MVVSRASLPCTALLHCNASHSSVNVMWQPRLSNRGATTAAAAQSSHPVCRSRQVRSAGRGRFGAQEHQPPHTGGVGPTTSVPSAAASCRCPTFTSSCASQRRVVTSSFRQPVNCSRSGWGACQVGRSGGQHAALKISSGQAFQQTLAAAVRSRGEDQCTAQTAQQHWDHSTGAHLRVAQQVGQALPQRLPRPRVVAAEGTGWVGA